MRILVTGASGLLGINISLEAAKNHTVFGTVKSTSIRSNDFQVLEADLLVPGTCERLLAQTQPDWVIHCAALAVLDECEANPTKAQQLNTEIPRELAHLVARGGARLLHVSTDAVFDGQRGKYCEEDSTNPLSVYARTKLEGEYAVASENPDAIIARVNLYGWSCSGKRSLGEFFYNNLKARNQINGFTDIFFCPLLANHLAHIFIEMLDKGLSGLYHVVSRECLSKYEFGLRIARQFGLDEQLIAPTTVNEAGLAAARSPNLTLRADKIARTLGHSLPDINSGIQAFFELYIHKYPHKLMSMSSAL